MSAITPELMRHALGVAQSLGLDTVELEVENEKFSAVIGKAPKPKASSTGAAPQPAATAADSTKPIKSSGVGYYRAAEPRLQVGAEVNKGDLVGSVVALGLANDLVAPATGIITEVMVQDGEVVDFGKVIATIEVSA
jgi:acetyl-CoA carboxylase biotin carboxyl carrier protein